MPDGCFGRGGHIGWPRGIADLNEETRRPGIAPEALRAGAWGVAITGLVGAAIVGGSRNLAHFDAALVAYTFSILFATFGLTYRYAMWLERPPTALYWRRGWQVVFRRGPGGRRLRNLGRGLAQAFSDIAPDERHALWFPYDQHWNQAGSDVFAEFMTLILASWPVAN